MDHPTFLRRAVLGAVGLLMLLGGAGAFAQGAGAPRGYADRVAEHWTAARRAQAIPRDLVIDERGLGYLRRPDGTLSPYGHDVAANAPSGNAQTPLAKPPGAGGGGGGGSDDTTPPSITNMDPGGGDVIGASHTFSATVTDASGVKSVTFVIEYPNGSTTQSFSASAGGNDTWSTNLSGFTDGDWRWWVVAKDNAGKGGNTATSGEVAFKVSTGTGGGGGGGGGGGAGTVTNAEWSGGAVQTAAGRLYFEMPGNAKWKGPWKAYVCSGTVVTDDTGGRSVILTAAHCVYDDVNKAFARNVLFIPDQAKTTGSGTDLNCNNDPLGCWAPSFGVVDHAWTIRTFPDNIPWDYAFYVADDATAHTGPGGGIGLPLDLTAGALSMSFDSPIHDDGTPGETSPDFTHALGYSYSEDPKFMYCAENMTTEGPDNWWLPSCGLSGGASGGPWIQPMDTDGGTGPVISVNSWGYTTSPGMAGPRFDDSSASCVFATAQADSVVGAADGYAGIAESCP